MSVVFSEMPPGPGEVMLMVGSLMVGDVLPPRKMPLTTAFDGPVFATSTSTLP
jgi:hypothetical protein